MSQIERVTWKEFLTWEPGKQEEYVRYIRATYNANLTNFSELFNASRNRIKAFFDEKKWELGFRVGHYMTVAERAVWEEFLKNGSEKTVSLGLDPADLPPAPVETDGYNPEEALEEFKRVYCPPECKVNSHWLPFEPPERMDLRSFSVKFAGKLDPAELMNNLTAILGRNNVGEIEIICKLGA